MAKIIAVDTGNASIKTTHHEFTAGLCQSYGFGTETIEFQGTVYELSGDRLPYMRRKSETNDYIILTLFAIMKELGGDDSKPITLAVGVPPAHYRTERKDFINYLKGGLSEPFQYKGVPKRLSIEDIKCFPQCFAAYAAIDSLKYNNTVYMIDIGGITTDILLFENGMPDMSKTYSLETGIHHLYNLVKKRVSSIYGVNISDNVIRDVLANSETLLQKDVLESIENTANEFAANLLRSIRELQVDFEHSTCLFLGGGSIALENYIQTANIAKNAVFMSDTKINAVGFEILAREWIEHEAYART